VAMIDERTSQNTADDAGINARLTLNILPIKGLNWDNFISYTQQRYESRQYSSRYYPSLIGEDGNAYISNEFSKDIQWESTVNYSKTFGKHSIQALAGYAYEKGVSQSSSMTNYGFDSDD
ncbi:MAG: TonB-dependent receptor, partial [Bacteroidales bacterium]